MRGPKNYLFMKVRLQIETFFISNLDTANVKPIDKSLNRIDTISRSSG